MISGDGDTLIGATIKRVRLIRPHEASLIGIDGDEPVVVIELDNGVVVVPLADDQGGSPGHLAYISDEIPYDVFVRKEPR